MVVALALAVDLSWQPSSYPASAGLMAAMRDEVVAAAARARDADCLAAVAAREDVTGWPWEMFLVCRLLSKQIAGYR